MKAAVYYETGAPDVLRYEDVPDPAVTPNKVLIQVEAVSIEGGDTLNRFGGRDDLDSAHRRLPVRRHDHRGRQRQSPIAPSATGSSAPAHGIPRRVGGGARHRRRGWSPTGSTSRSRVRADRLRHRRRLPLRVRATCSRARPSGAGRRRRRRSRRHPARQAGRCDGAGHRVERRPPRTPGRIRTRPRHQLPQRRLRRRRPALTDGRGVDLVVDSVGTTLAGSMRALAYRGRISYVGNAGRDQQPVDVSALMGGNQSIHGVFLGAELAVGTGPTTTSLACSPSRRRRARGGDRLAPIPLAEAAAAHAHLEDRQAFGRVVLVP
jgi:NADPH:quinone reductase